MSRFASQTKGSIPDTLKREETFWNTPNLFECFAGSSCRFSFEEARKRLTVAISARSTPRRPDLSEVGEEVIPSHLPGQHPGWYGNSTGSYIYTPSPYISSFMSSRLMFLCLLLFTKAAALFGRKVLNKCKSNKFLTSFVNSLNIRALIRRVIYQESRTEYVRFRRQIEK